MPQPDVPGYSRVHSRLSPLVPEDRRGVRILRLVSGRHKATGRIVYTVEKEVDFATSLYAGPYKDTGLAKAVKAGARCAGHECTSALSDFEMYEPSYGAPAAFAASAIHDNDGDVVGVLAIQLPNDEIDKVVSGDRGWERDGLGRSGDSGIVGSDYLLRSNARGFLQRREEASTRCARAEYQQTRSNEYAPTAPLSSNNRCGFRRWRLRSGAKKAHVFRSDPRERQASYHTCHSRSPGSTGQSHRESICLKPLRLLTSFADRSSGGLACACNDFIDCTGVDTNDSGTSQSPCHGSAACVGAAICRCKSQSPPRMNWDCLRARLTIW